MRGEVVRIALSIVLTATFAPSLITLSLSGSTKPTSKSYLCNTTGDERCLLQKDQLYLKRSPRKLLHTGRTVTCTAATPCGLKLKVCSLVVAHEAGAMTAQTYDIPFPTWLETTAHFELPVDEPPPSQRMPHFLASILRKKARPSPSTAEEIESKTPPAVVKEITFTPLELPHGLRSNPFSRSTYPPKPLTAPRQPKMIDMEPESSSDDTFRIMDLPPELRLRIFGFCFGNGTLSCHFVNDQLEYRHWPRGGHGKLQSSSLALLHLSRALAQAAMEALVASTTFIISVKANTSPYSNFHSSIHSTLRSFPTTTVHHAVFHFQAWGNADLEVCRQAMLLFPNLKTAELHFDFGCMACFEAEDARILDHVPKHLNRVRRMSSVGFQYERLIYVTKRHYLPQNELEGFQALLKKYKAIDVSAQQCGQTQPRLCRGDMYEVNTAYVDDLDE